MAHSVLRASMEVVTVLLHKDSAALARIDEMRQQLMERRLCKPGRHALAPRPTAKKDLPKQITWHYKVEPYREVEVHEEGGD